MSAFYKNLQRAMLLLILCLCFWMMGVLIGYETAQQAIHRGIYQAKNIMKIKTIKAPSQRQNPCGLAQLCPPQHHPFRLTSGVGLAVLPRLCFDNNSIFAMKCCQIGPRYEHCCIECQYGRNRHKELRYVQRRFLGSNGEFSEKSF
uniref:Uncharacterized protein n=1 Tax=Eptatretus burgeri TaxID=7764 RepID=A0A8C4NGK1_EPTBU